MIGPLRTSTASLALSLAVLLSPTSVSAGQEASSDTVVSGSDDQVRVRRVSADAATDSWVARAQKFRTLVTNGRYADARAMMADDAQRWFDVREGEGRPWRPGPESGPWSRWDEHFRSDGEIVEWRAGKSSATAVVREINDYFRLLERGSVTNEITYYFDAEKRIEGLLIAAAGERPPGRTEEFLAWAREHEPEELEALMPGGEIDPSGDHPRRFRALLNRWRVAAGLEPIERTPDSPEAPRASPPCSASVPVRESRGSPDSSDSRWRALADIQALLDRIRRPHG